MVRFQNEVLRLWEKKSMGIFRPLFGFILQTLLIITGIDCLLMGVLCPYFAKKCSQERSLPPPGKEPGQGNGCLPGQQYIGLSVGSNRIDLQTGLECAAYASAFVLRHFGREASGPALYRDIPGRRRDGTVYPKGVKKLL